MAKSESSFALHQDGHELPLYLQLTRILRTQIQSGEYRPQDALPPEDGLARLFGVSRITVREALRLLADEGLIIRHSGRGTFVAPRPEHGHSLWAAVTVPDVVYDGQEITRRYIKRRVIPASRGVAESLKLPPVSRILEVEGFMLLGSVPLAHVTLSVPYRLGRHVPKEHIVAKPLIQLLSEANGIRVEVVDQWTTASLADKYIAQSLGIPSGDPVLVIERIFYDQTGAPVELAVNRYRTDRFRHHVRLQRGVPSGRRRIVLRSDSESKRAAATTRPRLANRSVSRRAVPR
jgi:GntR family transcriptional regulator